MSQNDCPNPDCDHGFVPERLDSSAVFLQFRKLLESRKYWMIIGSVACISLTQLARDDPKNDRDFTADQLDELVQMFTCPADPPFPVLFLSKDFLPEERLTQNGYTFSKSNGDPASPWGGEVLCAFEERGKLQLIASFLSHMMDRADAQGV